jgi:pterin-4a-carbinolamine dehydratase
LSAKGTPVKKLFISYRHVDSYETNRLATALRSEYGEDNIFLDYQSIEKGSTWPDEIRAALDEASALIVIIGRNWLFMQDKGSGRRRIDLPNDWVRLELLRFLERKSCDRDLLLLPTLISGAKMPDRQHLDPELQPLCDIQPLHLPSTMRSHDFKEIKQRLENAGIYKTPLLAVVTPDVQEHPKPLSPEQEEAFIAERGLWRVVEHDKPGSIGESMRELYRIFEFTSYDNAWKFMTLVDEKGIRPFNHHPRWQNTYNRVEVWLCTFNIGHKPSERDLRLAGIMEEIWEGFAKGVQ